MDSSENRPETPLGTEVSTQTTCPCTGWLQRAAWTASLVVLGSVLAIHAALAYSPDLARFVPQGLIKLTAPEVTLQGPVAACHAPAAGGCQSRAMLAGDFGGCCSMRSIDRPLLTDGLYEEEPSDSFAEAPADAEDCLQVPSTSEATEPQASLPADDRQS